MAQAGTEHATLCDMRRYGPYLAALYRHVRGINKEFSAVVGRQGRRKSVIGLVVLLLMGSLLAAKPYAQGEKPFGLPYAGPSGPSTWLLSQLYGNTIFAYYQRNEIYEAGQGLHFGIDFDASCGTPVVAIGDGVVSLVDSVTHGALPHNLIIDHDNGYASLYGHLLERPELTLGEQVVRGQVVGLTGDPDLDCAWSGHLHLEIRDAGVYKRLYNPATLIAADWDSLALVGGYNSWYARDLSDPRRWQHIMDQPKISVWGSPLNDYLEAWPLAWQY